ncbi:sugar ABC transporter substrate-binding protein, partial [Micromonospora craterilacus]
HLTTTVAAVTGLAVALTACGGGDDNTSTTGGPLALYTWVSSQSDREQWESFIAEAQKEDPDLEITVEGPSFADYWPKVKTRFSGDDAPCLLTTQAARAQELGSLLMPLDDLVEEHDFDLSEVDESMLEGMTVDGSL